ncbi:pentatricopeptide repeat protein [Diplodia corticola]|uniref:Pentatricopeptide repeat protein n=1 Tax=Diplodia corticola TaxID=236234 RepID=A0A1J9QKQ7_9PEZI|nr:pentatricopeptide repeat protein [Diplodia corticola]OJD29462.1 pentatricopeptide repeat protein [Diplodia corticola]
MRPATRSFLRRPPWLSKPKARKQAQPQRRPWIAYEPPAAPREQEQEPGFVLDRARAAQVNEFLRHPVNPLRVRFPCSRDKQPYLDLLNLYLWKGLADPTHRKTAKALWRLYIKFRLTTPKFLRALSSQAWDILWRTQSLRVFAEPKIAAHLTQLAEDMQGAGHVANFEQRLVHIETLFGQGSRQAAVEKWQQGYQTAAGRTGDSYRPEYLELGVRMHAVAGNVTFAQKLLVDLFSSHPMLNPRLILCVFDAHLQASGEGETHVKQAWALYLRLKDLLGDSMAVKDYERCYTGFLKAGYREHALAVFRHLMSAGELRGPQGHKANATLLKGYNDLTSVLDNADELNQIFLSSLSALPLNHQNKFFFGKWINRLISVGDVDAAAQVYELMFQRDVQPQARHLNALVKAWIETRDPTNIDKAENLALQMVVRRITLMRRRKGLFTPPPPDITAKLRPPQKLFLRRTLPPATSDTFALLTQIYLQRNDESKLDNLHTWQVAHAELRTTPEALNMQLSFYLQRGYLSDVWRTLKRHVLRRPSRNVRATKPDMGTIALLWEASYFKQRTIGRRSPYDIRSRRTSFPPPTIILRHTLTWWRSSTRGPSSSSSSQPSSQPSPRQDATSRIPNHIVATYAAWNDLAGCLVAMHVLHRRLRSPVTQHTMTLLVRALARLGFPPADVRSRSPFRRRQLAASAGLHHNLDKVLQALRALLQRRLDAAAATTTPTTTTTATTTTAQANTPTTTTTTAAHADANTTDTNPDPNDKSLLLLEALSELTRAVLLRQGLPPARIEARVQGVKRRLGVDPRLPTGDKDAWEVAEELGM